MRKNIKKLNSRNYRFIAKVESFIFKESEHSIVKETILLTDIRLFSNKKIISDHIWIKNHNDLITFKKSIIELNINKGDYITFTAKKDDYTKCYHGNIRGKSNLKICSSDYTLTNYTKIQKL